MNNKWLKLALVSFVGIIVSILGLNILQAVVPQGQQSSHQMGTSAVSNTHGSADSAGGSQNHSMSNNAMGIMSGGMTTIPNGMANMSNGMVNTSQMQVQAQLDMLWQQIYQMRMQLNAMNNMGSSSGSMSMPMM